MVIIEAILGATIDSKFPRRKKTQLLLQKF